MVFCMVLLIFSYNSIVIHNYTEGIAGFRELHRRSLSLYSYVFVLVYLFFLFLL